MCFAADITLLPPLWDGLAQLKKKEARSFMQQQYNQETQRLMVEPPTITQSIMNMVYDLLLNPTDQ